MSNPVVAIAQIRHSHEELYLRHILAPAANRAFEFLEGRHQPGVNFVLAQQ